MNKEQMTFLIENMEYDREENLFVMKARNDKGKSTSFAIDAADWGVSSKVPDDIIRDFLKKMVGQKKNFIIKSPDSKEDPYDLDDLEDFPFEASYNYINKKDKENSSGKLDKD